MKNENIVKQKWAYIGQRLGVKFPLVDGWRVFADDGSVLHEKELYFKPSRARYSIGGIYEVTVDGSVTDGVRMVGSPAYSGATYGKDAVVLEWRAEHDISRAKVQLKKDERGAKEDELAALKPLQKLYMRASSTERAIIEVQVLQYLRMARVDRG